ncbi:MAG: T9SS C-terminal target domain-containing protein [Chitinophagaceae bacterium]|nr:MAG: T9SS C-terminal target domain-containing protein [Chitinophagaceae bacterium]
MQNYLVSLFLSYFLLIPFCNGQPGFDLQPTNFYIEDFDTEHVVYQVSFFTNLTQDSVEIAWKRDLKKNFPEEWGFTMEVGDVFFEDSVPESSIYVLHREQDLDYIPVFIAQVYPNHKAGLANFSFKLWDVNAPADTFNVTYTVNIKKSSTNVQESKVKAACNFHPNPLVEDNLRIFNSSINSDFNSENEVKIFDVRGSLVYWEKNKQILNLADLANGTYFLFLKTNEGECIEKIHVLR